LKDILNNARLAEEASATRFDADIDIAEEFAGYGVADNDTKEPERS
jgi:hypothetical protein